MSRALMEYLNKGEFNMAKIELSEAAKKARRDAHRKWREKNPEKIKGYAKNRQVYQKEYKEKNKERLKEYQRAYRKKNRKELRERAAEFRKKHPDKIAQYQEKYWENKAKEMQ